MSIDGAVPLFPDKYETDYIYAPNQRTVSWFAYQEKKYDLANSLDEFVEYESIITRSWIIAPSVLCQCTHPHSNQFSLATSITGASQRETEIL